MEKSQTSTSLVITAIVALLIGGVLGWKGKPVLNMSSTGQTQGGVMSPELELHKAMRKLWEDHIIWTRAYIVSAAYGNEDTEAVSQRLLNNQEDIGDAIKPYYGEEAGNTLTTLLKEHITTAVELVTAAKNGDQKGQNTADEKWYANANEIADFLASANPNWPKDEMRGHMRDHLDLTKQEAVDILGNKHEAAIADYDKIHEQILKMADLLTGGVVKQFPDKFK